ncbi:MAG: YjfB family protein [Eubacteriales bacterium]|nr:YjfB family protein [Eubacteriales bacterium]
MDIMGIGSMSMGISASKVSNDVEVLMLKKSLDTYETMGDNMTKMMESSVTPNLGQNIDVSL